MDISWVRMFHDFYTYVTTTRTGGSSVSLSWYTTNFYTPHSDSDRDVQHLRTGDPSPSRPEGLGPYSPTDPDPRT